MLHQHQLVSRRAPGLRIDDERAVHAAGDVLSQRPHVAVVEMQSEGFRVEGVCELLAGGDDPAAEHRHAVHLGGMDAVEMHGVRVLGAVDEPHAQEIALSASQRRSGDPAVERPRLEPNPRRDLDLPILCDDLPLTHHPPVGSDRGVAVVEVA